VTPIVQGRRKGSAQRHAQNANTHSGITSERDGATADERDGCAGGEREGHRRGRRDEFKGHDKMLG